MKYGRNKRWRRRPVEMTDDTQWRIDGCQFPNIGEACGSGKHGAACHGCVPWFRVSGFGFRGGARATAVDTCAAQK